MRLIRGSQIERNLEQLSILHPKDPKKIAKNLKEELNKLWTGGIIKRKNELPDRGAFDKVRAILGTPKKK